MNYINKLILQLLSVGLLISLAGCSKESKLWLHNFSGESIDISYPEQQISIESEGSALLKNWGAKRNTLEPYNLKIEFGESSFCYILRRITVGGYGQYEGPATLVLRFRLDQNKTISVYGANGEFYSNNPVGIQPQGYPALPEACPSE